MSYTNVYHTKFSKEFADELVAKLNGTGKHNAKRQYADAATRRFITFGKDGEDWTETEKRLPLALRKRGRELAAKIGHVGTIYVPVESGLTRDRHDISTMKADKDIVVHLLTEGYTSQVLADLYRLPYMVARRVGYQLVKEAGKDIGAMLSEPRPQPKTLERAAAFLRSEYPKANIATRRIRYLAAAIEEVRGLRTAAAPKGFVNLGYFGKL